MPFYIFANKKGKTKEIFFHMNDDKVYVENGETWQRIWTKPQAMFDAIKIDPFKSKDFSKRIERNKGKMGDLFDESKEMSERRIQIAGHDPVKEKYWQNWSKKRGGRKPPPTTDTVLEF